MGEQYCACESTAAPHAALCRGCARLLDDDIDVDDAARWFYGGTPPPEPRSVAAPATPARREYAAAVA